MNDIAFSPDGQFIALAAEPLFGFEDASIKLRRVSNSAIVLKLPTNFGTRWSVAISPDGSILAAGVNGNVILWSTVDGKQLRTLSGHTDTVFGVAFSPDGTTIASASADKTVKLWQVSSGNLLHTLTGHTNFVEGVTSRPTG